MTLEIPTTIIVDKPIDSNSDVFLVDEERDISESSVIFVQHLPLEPQPEITTTFPVVGVGKVEMIYEGLEAVKPCCSNCQHLEKVGLAGMDYLYCTNRDTKAFIEGGMLDNPILKPTEWHCPLHVLKAVG